jgi:hypothetical protein
MSYAYYAVISIFVCWKWGNWRNWKEYYPTILFMILGNVTYMVLCQNKSLWQSAFLLADYPILDISQTVVLYTSTVILFLTFYARMATRLRRIAYTAMWAGIFSAMELLSLVTGHYNYYNGWNFLYSIGFNAVMFPILLLHFKRPLAAWAVVVPMVYIFLFLFGIPLKRG